MLKVDMHNHCSEDPKDKFIKYSAKDLIDHAAKLNFDVLSITCHNKVVYSMELKKYAETKNILLIPGAEKDIDKRHVLLYNFTQDEIEKIKNIEDLRNIKKENHLVIAPHPFYFHLNPFNPKQISLFSRVEKDIDLFDAIEYCHFYTKLINHSNKKAADLAAKHDLALIANSDLHHLANMGSNFSFIDSKKDINSIFKAIKDNKVTICSRPRNTLEIIRIISFLMKSTLKQKVFNIIK